MKKIISILVALGLVLGLTMVATPAVSGQCDTSLENCAVVVNPDVECVFNATYNVTFTTNRPLAAAPIDYIIVTFPAGANATNAVANVNGAGWVATTEVGDTVIYVPVPAGGIPSGTAVALDITDVVNPPDGAYDLLLRTTGDDCDCEAPFTILPGGYLDPTTAQWGINSCNNVTFPIVWEGSTNITAVNGLTWNVDFLAVGDTLHIDCAYLMTLGLTPCGTQTFEVEFDPGCNTTVTITAYASCNVTLGPQWNLMSLPLIPKYPAIEEILADIDDYVESVWYYDCGSWYVYKNGTSFDTLETMDYCASYWICMNQSATLQVTGWEYECPPAMPPKCCYHECWNMVGYKSCVSMNASDYLASLSPAGAIYGMLTWNGTAWQVVTPSTMMVSGQGYWMAFIADACFVPPL